VETAQYVTVPTGVGKSYLADALGSTVALTNPDGTVTTAYTYAPFGTTVADNPTDFNPFQFTGRENDGTGLYYYRARYYHPGLARFISEDPLGQGLYLAGWSRLGRQGLLSVNAYVYAGNNPLRFVDPTGLRYMAARVYFLDTFLVFHAPDVYSSLFDGITFEGFYEIKNAPCAVLCFFEDDEWDRLKQGGPWNALLGSPASKSPPLETSLAGRKK
jgi:RHS repeat-associated protein